jgi:phosphoenolpyruvate synthase/pyruvate phosphate dikinase
MYLVNLKTDRLSNTVGNKAWNLRRLHDWGFRIPGGLVCSFLAYQRYCEGDLTVLADLTEEFRLRQLFPGGYAVRSSADLEDSFEQSFAGQFKSFLNVDNMRQLLQAIREIWDTADTPAIRSYTARLNEATRHPQMAVIVQEMVSPFL